MLLTAQTALIRHLTVAAAQAPSAAPAGGVPERVLRALGADPERLPPRTRLYLAGPAGRHRGIPVHGTEPDAVLARAHRDLLDRHTDLALVATGTDPLTVQVLRRAAEAVADGDPVLGVLSDAPGGADGTPVLEPLHHGFPARHPDAQRLLLWSGRDEADAAQARAELLRGLEADPAARPPAAPAHLTVRGAVVAAADRAEEAVRAADAVVTRRPRPVGLLFPGQGAQHARMAAGLYRREPVFTAAADAVLDLMGADGPAIRADWLSDRPLIDVDDVRRAQPLLFAVDYALGRMVLGWGVRPTAMLGHSAGELVAATLCGVVSLPDAVAMMRERVVEAVKIPAGGMLAVAASEQRLRPYLTGDVAIAAVNTGQQTMLAGSVGPLAEVAAALRADRHTVIVVPASSPFHCSAMAPAADAVEIAYRGIRLRVPDTTLYSGYTGDLMTAEDALSPRYWARQLTDTVHFAPALDQLLAADDMLLIEAGPRQTLTAFARRHRSVRLGASVAVPMLPAKPGEPEDDRRSVLNVAARLWTEGHDLDQAAVSRLWSWREDAPAAGVRDEQRLAAVGS